MVNSIKPKKNQNKSNKARLNKKERPNFSYKNQGRPELVILMDS